MVLGLLSPPGEASQDASSSSDADLEAFRLQWRAELKQGKTAHPASIEHASPSPSGSTSYAPHARPLPQTEVDEHTRHLRRGSADAHPHSITDSIRSDIHEEPGPHASAVEVYESAAEAERQGLMGEALRRYRRAFKLDDNVDKAYHQAFSKPSSRDPATTTSRSSDQARRSAVGDEYVFARTVQVGPDYVAARDAHSTDSFKESLIDSFGKHPYPHEDEGEEPEKPRRNLPPPAEVDPASPPFLPADPDLPFPLERLPQEVWLHILSYLAVPTADNAGRYRSADVTAIELFARVSRRARLLTLDLEMWKRTCVGVYISPHLIEPPATPTSLGRTLYQGDWRRMYIDHPRLRFDGCYIAVTTYMRPGESDNLWFSPTHLVTFYRYLRLYPNGTVLSLQTTTAPRDIVRDLDVTIKLKGAMVGRWELRDRQVFCWALRNADSPVSRKYDIHMRLGLLSTARGRMNKLNLHTLYTHNRQTAEREPIAINHQRPFYCSRVIAFER